MHSLSRTTWSRKGGWHGARHGRTEEQKEYHIAWNAWKRCCKKIDSQGGHFTGIHDRFLRHPVYRESQLAIGWTKHKCKEMDELTKQDHTYHLSKEEFKWYQGQWYLTLDKSGKNAPMRLRPDFRAAVSLLKKNVSTASEANKLKSLSIQNNKKWHPSSITPWWDTSEWNWALKIHFLSNFFCYRWFWIAIHCKRRVCRQMHLTRHFSHALHTSRLMWILTVWLKTSHWKCLCSAHSFHLHAIHDERLIVRSLSVSSCLSSVVSLRCLPLLFHTLLALWPALLLPCGQRQGKHPLRLRPMRSIAPWRYTIHPRIKRAATIAARRKGHVPRRSRKMTRRKGPRSARARSAGEVVRSHLQNM